MKEYLSFPVGAVKFTCCYEFRRRGWALDLCPAQPSALSPRPSPPQGFKLGICATPPVGVQNALLCLANNCAIAQTFGAMKERFNKLYKRRCVDPLGA